MEVGNARALAELRTSAMCIIPLVSYVQGETDGLIKTWLVPFLLLAMSRWKYPRPLVFRSAMRSGCERKVIAAYSCLAGRPF